MRAKAASGNNDVDNEDDGTGKLNTMIMRRTFVLPAGMWLAIVIADAALAQGVSLVLPPGEVITGTVYQHNGSSVPSVTTGQDANNLIGATSPTLSFVPADPAAVVRTGTYTQYVRFYNNQTSFPAGAFIASANLVRGLTPAQVKDVLALPALPTGVTVVQVPAGTCVLTAQGAAIAGYGNGGVQQSYLIGVSDRPGCQNPGYLLLSAYFPQHPIGAFALAYGPLAGTGNTGAVAAALDHATPPPQFTDMDSVYASLDLLNYGDPQPLRNALAQLDGEVYADAASVQIAGAQTVLGVVGDRMRLARGAVDDPPGWRSWLTGFGAGGGASGNGTAHDVSLSYGGLVAGADYRLDPTLLVGGALAYTYSSFTTSGIPGNGSLNTGSLLAYASYAPGPWYVDGSLGYAYSGGDVDRSIVFPGQSRAATGKPDANLFLSGFETGYRVPIDPTTRVTPYLGLQAITATGSSFTESGAGAIDLNVRGATTASVRSFVGVGLEHALPVGLEQPLWISLRAAWAYEFASTTRSITAGFTGTPDAAFTVDGAASPRNAAQLGAALTLPVGALQFFLRYDGTIGSGYAVNGGSAGMRATF